MYSFPAQIGLFWTQCFVEYAEFVHYVLREIKARRQKWCILFFFYKKQR